LSLKSSTLQTPGIDDYNHQPAETEADRQVHLLERVISCDGTTQHDI